MNKEITLTDKVLADMLTENTGSHMLDSGGAYGRNWERNQGRDVQAFMDAPEVEVSQWGISLDLFHYLRQRLEFMPEIQAEFDELAELEENKKTSWYELIEDWCKKYQTDYLQGFNSYNYECLLSQTIQGHYFEYNDDVYLMLQIHGGADVRGGYTAPKIFRECGEPGMISYEWDTYIVQSADDRKGEKVCLEFNHGDVADLMGNGEWIGSGYRYDKKNDDDPLLDYFGDLEWDEATKSFLAPDGDGHVEFLAPESNW
jgi:hypothetical protein